MIYCYLMGKRGLIKIDLFGGLIKIDLFGKEYYNLEIFNFE